LARRLSIVTDRVLPRLLASGDLPKRSWQGSVERRCGGEIVRFFYRDAKAFPGVLLHRVRCDVRMCLDGAVPARDLIGMADAKKIVKDRRRFGPYSKRLHRGAIGDLVDGRSAQGRFIRHLEAELIVHVCGSPTIVQRMLIDRTIKIRLQLDALDEKLSAGDWSAHDQRTYGALLNAQHLCLRELGPPGTVRRRLESTPEKAQAFGVQTNTKLTLTPAEAYQAMLEGKPLS